MTLDGRRQPTLGSDRSGSRTRSMRYASAGAKCCRRSQCWHPCTVTNAYVRTGYRSSSHPERLSHRKLVLQLHFEVGPCGGGHHDTEFSANPGGDAIWVYAECYQDGQLVYAQYVEADANNEAVLSLGPTPSWTGGSASCTAEEGYFNRSGRWHTVAETTFEVSG